MVKNLARNVMNRQLVRRTARSKTVSFSILLILLTAGVGVSVGAPKKHPGPINVGMIPLLASPEKYNGKIIRTIGFLHIGPMRESDILCLYEDDGKFSLFKNTFALDLSEDQRKQFLHLNHTYVLSESGRLSLHLTSLLKVNFRMTAAKGRIPRESLRETKGS